jgi:diguanylate cyclase (GGDEF)-like protein
MFPGPVRQEEEKGSAFERAPVPSNGHSSNGDGQRTTWSVATSNKHLDTQIREGLSPTLFDGMNRGLLDLLTEIEKSSLEKETNKERLLEIRTLLIKAAHSVAIQSEILSELRLLALTDDLTGFFNRRGFLILGMQQLKVSRRTGQPLLLFFADVDGLKNTNDLYGHDEGDALLMRCAAALNNTFREADIVARLGGDEFAILAAEGADCTCEIILSRLENAARNINAQGGAAPLSLSMGVARFDPQAPVTLAELLTTADQNMYAKKRSRRSYRVEEELAPATD